MLNKAKTLRGYKFDSLDGQFGAVEQFYFDDRYWTIRYLVANTGNHPEVDDLLDDLGEMVLSKSGQVVVIRSEQMPTRTGTAATCRF